MKVVAEWIQEFLDQKLTVDEMADALECAGVEIEEVVRPAKFDTKIVASRILKVAPHPKADRLRLATVETGQEELEIVCGAPNIEEGQIVPLAQVGARLPDGTLIEAAEIREVKSNGMLCSARELGLSNDHSGILVLDDSVVPGTPLGEVYGGQELIDLTTAANRPDLQSVTGIAREAAAFSKAGFSEFTIHLPKAESPKHFRNEIPDQVPRYMLGKVELKTALATSPDWLRERLVLAGIRPISPIVDITNYVLLETGQPLHAFDARKIKEQLIIRRAISGESLTALDGVTYQLDPADIVIADAKQPVALGGIMGGANSEVGEDTTEILLEAAIFYGAAIRHSSKRHGLRTEASGRFERQLPLEFPTVGMSRALQLLDELIGIKQLQLEDTGQKSAPRSIAVRPERLSDLAGVTISKAQVLEALNEAQVPAVAAGEEVEVNPPYWRPDLEREEDVFEEVVKHVGLDTIPATLPRLQPPVQFVSDKKQSQIWQLRTLLQGLGYSEIITYPFASDELLQKLQASPSEHFELQNPKSVEQKYLRSSLLPSSLLAAEKNQRLHPEFGFFEIGTVFLKSGAELVEQKHLGALWRGTDSYSRVKQLVDELTARNNLEVDLTVTPHPLYVAGRFLTIQQGAEVLGSIGELQPELLRQFKIPGSMSFAELDVNRLIELSSQPVFRPLPLYQQISRDITLILDTHIFWKEIHAELTQAFPDLTFRYVGDYQGSEQKPNERALTINLSWTPAGPHPSETELAQEPEKIVKHLVQRFGARLQK